MDLPARWLLDYFGLALSITLPLTPLGMRKCCLIAWRDCMPVRAGTVPRSINRVSTYLRGADYHGERTGPVCCSSLPARSRAGWEDSPRSVGADHDDVMVVKESRAACRLRASSTEMILLILRGARKRLQVVLMRMERDLPEMHYTPFLRPQSPSYRMRMMGLDRDMSGASKPNRKNAAATSWAAFRPHWIRRSRPPPCGICCLWRIRRFQWSSVWRPDHEGRYKYNSAAHLCRQAGVGCRSSQTHRRLHLGIQMAVAK